jgi:tRNA modification GTPase
MMQPMTTTPRLSVTLLTPPGRGAVATLRLEGPDAVAILQANFCAKAADAFAVFPCDRLFVGRFGGEQGEDVVVRRCQDDVVELHCHGGLAALAKIEAALVAAGCQRLSWRDWTIEQHADAEAAAAWIALAEAPTERTAAILLNQYHGVFQRECLAIRDALDNGDFAEAQRRCEAVETHVALGRHLVEPWRVALAGRVNVGKSSLMNVLAGYQRSIIHATPGTTRDVVTIRTAIDGWPVELCGR